MAEFKIEKEEEVEAVATTGTAEVLIPSEESEFAHEQEITPKRMRGTEGNYDYNIVARKNDVLMGLKVLPWAKVIDGHTRCGVIVRLRVAFREGANLVGYDLDRELHSAFKGLPFETSGSTPYGYRLRTHLTFFTTKTHEQAGQVFAALRSQRFYGKLMAFLTPLVQEPAYFTLSYEDFLEALEEQAMEHYAGGDVGPLDDEPTNDERVGSIINRAGVCHTDDIEESLDGGDDHDETGNSPDYGSEDDGF